MNSEVKALTLPIDFQEKMKKLLGEEYPEFEASYLESVRLGFRLNPEKCIEGMPPFEIKDKIPWTQNGYYYSKDIKAGKHPYHEAGVYYIQEPSAMIVGELADAKPGEIILDLCAAPGGKSTHMASVMRQSGLLISNEIHPSRAKILSQNVERMGLMNTIVLNESPDRLSQRLISFFDKIVVDAPCSGEGMFRKDENAVLEWSLNHVAMCAGRQWDILIEAFKMLKPGGRLIYSTCTFSPEENEQMVKKVLMHYSDVAVVAVSELSSISRGRSEWAGELQTGFMGEEIEKSVRLWPHLIEGEGHFAVIFEKRLSETEIPSVKPMKSNLKDKSILEPFELFSKQYLKKSFEERFYLFGEHLYLFPEYSPDLERLKVLRAGLQLGTFKKNRFEPSHALALALKPGETQWNLDLKSNAPEVTRYLQGHTLDVSSELEGWVLVSVDGYSLGWGKATQGTLKNHYPKGLRWV